jgi:DNA-binding CsgD family transcriptional regulator
MLDLIKEHARPLSMKNRIASKSSSMEESLLEKGREAFRKRAWGAAFSQLSEADRQTPLAPEYLSELSQAALLIGKDAEGVSLLARAHQAFMDCGAIQPAARCAFWLGFISLLNGEVAKGSGWLSRAGRLLADQPDCCEKGYLLVAEAYGLFRAGDAAGAQARFEQAGACGLRFKDRDLATLALQGHGRALIRQGEIARGLTLLDEAMIAVTADEVSALNAGGVYCSVLDACGEIFDLKRAREWTEALEQWCASQPDLVPYRGHCLVRRAELLQLHGDWPDALVEAQRASEWLSHPVPKPSLGSALYQVGEILRLRGRFAEAEEAYRGASERLSNLGPGCALLRLAQGQVEMANALIRRLQEEVHEPGPRARVLHACVEIALASRDISAAQSASKELEEIASRYDIPFLRAMSCHTSGAVLLALGQSRDALTALRRAWTIWGELCVPYEAARVRVLMGRACQELGDEQSALVEFTAAREMFLQLGAVNDLAFVDSRLPARKTTGPLSTRELEVLRLVASGMTNREIGQKLFISEKTVARHLSNIFTKLDLNSRTAATAYAYDHSLV